MEELRLTTDDGVLLPATAFAPAASRAALVIAPAMGVPRQYYRRFGADLAARGIGVLAFDYRGVGDARAAVPDPANARLEDWGRCDLEAALVEARRRFPATPLFLLGHSVGTQLVGLAPSSESLAGLVFVAGSAPHARHYPGLSGIGTWMWMHAIVPLFARGDWFPARRLRFSTVDVPGGVARQWATWGRSARYLFSAGHGLDTRRYRRLRAPGLAVGAADDPLAPRATMRALLDQYPQVRFEEWWLLPAQAGVRAIGHAGFFREELREALWRPLADWLLATAARHGTA
ncbi:MAG TPA: alpha/beta fold hydrolase [Candidatus Binatia bacterium]|nr:alpha/beta fold hydrolase [Candidatus Binatia bacterium]